MADEFSIGPDDFVLAGQLKAVLEVEVAAGSAALVLYGYLGTRYASNGAAEVSRCLVPEGSAQCESDRAAVERIQPGNCTYTSAHTRAAMNTSPK